MNKEQLVIEKLVVDVYMNNDRSENPSKLLFDLSEEIKSSVLPMLEKRLDDSGVNNSNEHVVIDSLSIDVFASVRDDWQDGVAQKLVEEIRDAESDKKMQLAESNLTGKVDDPERSLFEAWTHFLNFGVLPNWRRELGINSLKELLVRLENNSSEFATNMRPLLKEDIHVFTRSILLLNDKLLDGIFIKDELVGLASLIRNLPPERKELKEFKHALVQTAFDSFRKGTRINLDVENRSLLVEKGLTQLRKVSPAMYSRYEKTIHELTELLESSNNSNLLSLDELESRFNLISDRSLRNLIETLLEDKKVSFYPKRIIHSFLRNGNQLYLNWSNFLEIFPELLDSSSDQIAIESAVKDLPSTLLDSVRNQLKEKLRHAEQQHETLTDQKAKQEREDTLFIENAGLVLLKPFLPQLFTNLNLLNEANNWNEAASQMEAMYILHFMVTNTFEATEDQLFLAKLLTGWDVNEPVEMPSTILGISTQNFEAIEAVLHKEQNDLLAFIRQNWRPMRNASWAGLQRDFLSRSGTLTKTDERNYTLKVDEGALDVMLPHKNWGIGIIKYSWMECMINVEW